MSVGLPHHPDLPEGLIKWGFLKFKESGQFVIDQSQMDGHIEELQRQLKACEHSVFAWVQAYNKYVALSDVIEARFDVRDIPPGWFLWPMAMGGLEVKSPLIPQFAIRDRLYIDPAKKLKDESESEKETYIKLREKCDSGDTFTDKLLYWDPREEPFMPYEYVRHRERYIKPWGKVYNKLLSVPLPEDSASGGVSRPSYLVLELSNLSQRFHLPADSALQI